MSRRPLPLIATVATFAIAASAFTVARGGWAVITVEDPPEYLTATKPVEITFLVRQHGQTLLDGLHPTVYASSGSSKIQASAIPAKALGRYSATLVVPKAGDWTITIHSGFMNSKTTLAPLPAVAPGAPAPRAIAAAERGAQLFVAKGCATCHVHGAVEGSGPIAVGPNLTPKRYQADYLVKFFQDPSIALQPGQTFVMPKLELRATEVAALTAFINQDRQISARQ